MIDLHTKEKAIEYTDGVMVRERGGGEGKRREGEKREGGREVKAVGRTCLLLPLHITLCIVLYGESNVLYLVRMGFGVRVHMAVFTLLT